MKNLKGEFVIREGNDLITYNNIDDIPKQFDNLIKFKPDFPEPPHTSLEHDGMKIYKEVFDDLMSRERKSQFTNF